MSPLLALYCLALLTNLISATTVKWLPNSSFKLRTNYKDGKLPCSRQTVVFPQTVVGSIKIASGAEGTQVAGFILPQDGELILDGLITFGSDPRDTNCTDGYAYYVDKTSSSWNQADVWSSPKFNDATPDSDRIPCFNDVVEFPADSKFTAVLPDEVQYIKDLRIGNTSYSNTEFLVHVLRQSDAEQQFVVNKFYNTGLMIREPIQCSQFGCACQKFPLEIDCSMKFCPKPSCLYPVKPVGFCCEICGGYIVFDADKGFDMKSFEELVENTIKKYGSDRVQYHIGFTPEVPQHKVQLVVVDKGEYEGLSAEIINSISYALDERWIKGYTLTQISGSPLYKSGMGGKIFVSMFFAVVLSMGALYVYYYKIPEIRFPIFTQNGPGNMFLRFQRRSDSVVSLTRRDSVMSTTSRGTAFRNPLYDSKRGRVEVTESAAE